MKKDFLYPEHRVTFIMQLLNKKNKFKNTRGFTLLEACITLIILSMLFGSGYMILTYSRTQQAKGFWIQQSISQLRNTTKRIEKEFGSASYPSAQVKIKGKTKVFNFFDYKRYSGSRLTEHRINKKEKLERMSLKIVENDTTIKPPTSGEQEIMRLVKCTPSVNGGKGIATWTTFVLAPSKHYSHVGDLYVEEFVDDYKISVSNDEYKIASDVFDINVPFEKGKLKNRKLLVNDVYSVHVSNAKIEDASNIQVETTYNSEGKVEGVKATRNKREKKVIVLTIRTQNPKDAYTILEDRACNVINVNSYEDIAPMNKGWSYIDYENGRAKIVIDKVENAQFYGKEEQVSGGWIVKNISQERVDLFNQNNINLQPMILLRE